MRVPATECPRISEEFLEEDRGQQKGDFEMEYMCEFREDGHSVFSRDLVEEALDGSRCRWWCSETELRFSE